jgi:hypothetical protein
VSHPTPTGGVFAKFALFPRIFGRVPLSGDPRLPPEAIESPLASKEQASAGHIEGFPQFPQEVGSDFWTGQPGRIKA